MKKSAAVLSVFALAVALTGCSAETPPAETVSAAAATETVTETPEPKIEEKEVEVEVEKEVEVTPESCIIALDTSGEAMEIAAQYVMLIPEAAEAGFDRDMAAIEDITTRMDEMTVKVNAAKADMGNSAIECRDAAK